MAYSHHRRQRQPGTRGLQLGGILNGEGALPVEGSPGNPDKKSCTGKKR